MDFASIMIYHGVTALNSLIASPQDNYYFIGNGPSGARVYGFMKTGPALWQFLDLAQSASVNFGHPALAAQVPAAHSVTYDAANNKIYYCGTDGLLYYYLLHSGYLFEYFAFDGNYMINLFSLTIQGNVCIYDNRFYFVALKMTDGYQGVYCCYQLTGYWYVHNLDYFANSVFGTPFQAQAIPNLDNKIALSPDGTMITYFGTIVNPVAVAGNNKVIAFFRFWGVE